VRLDVVDELVRLHRIATPTERGAFLAAIRRLRVAPDHVDDVAALDALRRAWARASAADRVAFLGAIVAPARRTR
jgi:hypothetical protein